jgi:pyruvate kinase
MTSFNSPAAVRAALAEVRDSVATEGAELLARWRPEIENRTFAPSAANLAHYLALRRRDLRHLQEALVPLGLSSLGRLEGRVLANLDAVLAALSVITGKVPAERARFPRPRQVWRGVERLAAHTDELFGPPRPGRPGRILVTVSAEPEPTAAQFAGLMRAGADAFRINCAHDDVRTWQEFVSAIRAAEAEVKRPTKILMDLAGPKCRTAEVLHPKGNKRINKGDRLLLARNNLLPRSVMGFQATCTPPQVVDSLVPGAPVWVDDGHYGGVVEEVGPDGAVVAIRHTKPGGGKLKPDKGLNFPATDLGLAALTEKDCEDLDFVAANADMIGYSFVQQAADIERLQEELAARRPDWRSLGLVAKIETPRAVANLPGIIVRAAGRQPFAVMIARGDLAVELGFERTAEIQEEILWLAEAAHVPVIWATQVLENLVRNGEPSRGEMTDAAMAARAECVMLNKGPYVAEAAQVLDRLLTRMAEHQSKKTPRLRALKAFTVA